MMTGCHDPRTVPWALWLLSPFLALGIISLILAVVSMLAGPLGFLPPSLGGAGN